GEVGAGEVLPMAHVMSGFRRDDLEEGETNPLINGSPVSAALAADTALQARHRLGHAEQIFALSVEAFGAPLDAYDDVLDDLWGDEDEASALAALRRQLEGASPEGRASAAATGLEPALGGLVEEARAAAMPTLLPAAVNDPQDDVSSPTFSAYRRQARGAECLDSALAVLAAEASQALFAAGRQPAPPL